MPKTFLDICRAPEDPGRTKKPRYPLDEILFLCVCAVLSGAEGWSAIAQFGQAKLIIIGEPWPVACRREPARNGLPGDGAVVCRLQAASYGNRS